ncbi:DNA damage response protein RcaA [Gaeumannomyces tritici R3-111a-1]|uniref:DNA damage response protein RcaA n=1 Tax=Gaeumannomyces tritici (strain R3-111a-1) TaxID=644352 RepID=J3PAD7_GAET3|nr:DNA damage response protein RcaA [Gaeumannomyces tritici R3-111a-1]EJT71203.1 DNA damage response protein RcaA [Gaeumannomyces tritici R3-111a-1]
MWLLENDGDIFQGRRLWLRPGKTYLFGRTSTEPGILVVADKSISRKHLTITVGKVKEGDAQNRKSRSTVTVEDLKTKMGTQVNGTQIKGTTCVLTQESNALKLGSCNHIFRLSWHPVVCSVSFTKRELAADAWLNLRQRYEQLDIKFIADYDRRLTTHVVTKKRNTPKGLQALIGGRYIVTDTFLDAVTDAAVLPSEGTGASALEQDFDVNWPNPLNHIPPRGDEPTDRPGDAYEPNERRREVFDGYTFIFFEKAQHDNLMPVIADGKGKALLREVVPHETEIDDFIGYVKGVAGEKGLGEFEGGSEGKGVVVVRYAPPMSRPDLIEWYTGFINTVSLRLDHRMIDQREFLDAILAVDASMLRRPLETETGPIDVDAAPAPRTRARNGAPDAGMEIDQPVAPSAEKEPTRGTVRNPTPTLEPDPSPPRPARKKRRFKGFDDSDEDEEKKAPSPEPSPRPIRESGPEAGPPSQTEPPSQSMFVSQVQGFDEPESGTAGAARSTRKRAHSPIPEEMEVEMGGGTSVTTASKRQRVYNNGRGRIGRVEIPPSESEDEVEAVPESPKVKPEPAAAAPGVRGTKGLKKNAIDADVLTLARRNLEETEAKAREEAERLVALPEDGIDAAEVRRLTIVEDMPVISRGPSARTREQDIADGRWDPHWNGRQNFKKFRKAGGPAAPRQAPQRIMVECVEEKNKEYGIGDSYWADEPTQPRAAAKKPGGVMTQGQQRESGAAERRPGRRPALGDDSSDDEGLEEARDGDDDESLPNALEVAAAPSGRSGSGTGDADNHAVVVVVDDDSDAEEVRMLPRTRKGKAAEKANTRLSQRVAATQTNSGSSSNNGASQAAVQSQGRRATRTASGGSTASTASKRAAQAPPPSARPAKKARAGREVEVADSDDSSDGGGGKFRFGKR